MQQFNHELGKTISTVTPAAQEILQRHDWPGNVREFQSAIRYAMVHATSDVITEDCLPASCGIDTGLVTAALPASDESLNLTSLVQQLLGDGRPNLYEAVQSEVDRVVMDLVMRHTGGNQVQAAQVLGISRMTLRSKLRTLGLLSEKTGPES